MSINLYHFIFCLLCFCNCSVAQINLQTGYYQTSAIDFNFRTDQPHWLPTQQIENTIEELLQEVAESQIQIKVAVAVQDTLQQFDENIQQLIGQLLQKKEISTEQVIYIPTTQTYTTVDDKNKGYYATVELSVWEKLEQGSTTEEETNNRPDETKEEKTVVGNYDAYQSFMEQQQQQTTQTFSFSGNEPQTITGKAGTVIHVPANSFVDQSGSVIEDTVLFTLKEVYTLKDMIIQDVVTMSGDEMIETGGMLYLEAKTTSGEVLELADNKTILATMASPQSSLSGMQTFEGVEDAAGRVDWIPTDKAVVLPDNKKQAAQYNTIAYIPSMIKQCTDRPKIKNKPLPPLPTYYPKPFLDTVLPAKPMPIECRKIPRAEILQQYPIQKGENRDHYNKRIGRKIKQSNHKYYKTLHKNKVAVSHYQNELARYRSSQRLYKIRARKYDQYCKDMKKILHQMATEVELFDLDAYQQYCTYASMAFAELSTKYSYQLQRLAFMKDYATTERKKYPKLDSILTVAASNHRRMLQMEERVSQLYGLSLYQNRSKATKGKQAIQNWTAVHAAIQQLQAQIAEKTELSTKELEQIQALYQEVCVTHQFNKWVNAMQSNQKTIQSNKSIIHLFLSMEQAFIQLEQQFEQTKATLNIVTPQEFANQYGGMALNNNANDTLGERPRGTLRIDVMGWVNCDRRLQFGFAIEIYNTAGKRKRLYPGKPVDCELLVKQIDNTRFYMTFEDINTTLPPSSIQQLSDDTYRLVFERVPQNLKAQIIGIQLQSDSIGSYYKKTGKVRKLTTLHPTFEETSTDSLLDSVVAH